jgi:hypothetical protein
MKLLFSSDEVNNSSWQPVRKGISAILAIADAVSMFGKRLRRLTCSVDADLIHVRRALTVSTLCGISVIRAGPMNSLVA